MRSSSPAAPSAFGDVIVVGSVEAVTVNLALEAALRAARSQGIGLDGPLPSPDALGHGVALGHASSKSLSKPVILFVNLTEPVSPLTPEGITPDGVPIRHLLYVVVPDDSVDARLALTARLTRAFADPVIRRAAKRARTGAELIDALGLSSEDRAPPEAVDPLEPSGRFGGGLARDLRGYASRFASDFRDGLHPKVLASASFLYFACLAPAVAFGALMSEKTNGAIGAVEMILATAFCGVIYSLLSSQPLVILGGTGPLLVFTAVLYDLCQRLSLPFLPVYSWVGLWTMAFLLLAAVTEASRLVRTLTRFTDEIFAGLISVIFIVEAVSSTIRVAKHPESTHASGLLSVMLVLGTYQIARTLARLRKTPYLRRGLREGLADFGPAIAMGAMGYLAYRLHVIDLPSLDLPRRFATTSGRPWVASLTSVPVWLWFASAVPASFATILLFLDQNITSRIINASSHQLKKPVGYHMDLVILGVLVGACSLLGLPWLVAATVRSLNHLRSLATYQPDDNGELRMTGVRETRASGLLIHLLVGASLFLLPLLSNIPLPIVYGLFLYMGVSSLAGNQFIERVRLFVTDPELYPENHYLAHVKRRTVHGFTLLQLLGLGALWLVKTSPLAILFPVALVALVPLRWFAGRLFDKRELAVLDSDELPGSVEARETE